MTRKINIILCAACLLGISNIVDAKPAKKPNTAKVVSKKIVPITKPPALTKINCTLIENQIVGTASKGDPVTKANPELNYDLAFDFKSEKYCFESGCEKGANTTYQKNDIGELILETPFKPSNADSWGDYRSTSMIYNKANNTLNTKIIYYSAEGYNETGYSLIKMSCKAKN